MFIVFSIYFLILSTITVRRFNTCVKMKNIHYCVAGSPLINQSGAATAKQRLFIVLDNRYNRVVNGYYHW